jgi:hypothetical protein
MASPAELMQTVSAATGVPLATITDLDRRLAKAGLRTKSGRGLNVARMTALDAARLLTAMLASPQGNEAVEAVARYVRTCADRTQSNEGSFVGTELGELAALPAAHGFVDALTALIASASTGAIAHLMSESGHGWAPRIEVFAFTRAVRGRIRIAGLPNGQTASVEYVPGATAIRPSRAGKAGARKLLDSNGDLEQSRRVTERTILPVAELLVGES